MTYKSFGTKNNLFLSNEEAGVWRKKGSAYDPKLTNYQSVK